MKKFYNEVLDTSVPELKRAAEFFNAGNSKGAAAEFAAYVKSAVKPEIYFKLPEYETAQRWSFPGEDFETAANRICEGKLMACNFLYHFKDCNVDWFSNPTYNGYKEWTWQLSRHPEFRCLGDVYRKTGDEKYAKCFEKLITSWILQAECPRELDGHASKCWRTIEAGIRMTENWHFGIHAFIHSESIADESWVMIFKSLWEHAYRLSGFCTENNWLIMEMTGLIHIAAIYPFFKERKKWLKFGFDKMQSELEAQVYPDGVQFELATGYHHVIIINYQFVVDICSLYGIETPKRFMEVIHLMYEFYPKTSRPDEKIPDINDGDIYHLKPLMKQALHYFPNDGGFKYFLSDKKEGTPPDYNSFVFPYSGFAVMREGWEKNSIWAFFESAPFGKAHQHEDKLTFSLFAYGANMLDDSGIYEYDASDMRKYILSTRAHNICLVDGMGQNRRDGYDREKDKIYEKSDLLWLASESYEVAEGKYNEGYGKDKLAVTHTRRVIYFKKGIGSSLPFFLLLDKFEPEDNDVHKYEVSFQLGSEPLSLFGSRATMSHGNGATLTLTSTAYPTVQIAQKYPEFMGWRPIRRPDDHEHEPAPVLAFTKSGICETVATVAYPAPTADVPKIDIFCDSEGFEIEIAGVRKSFKYTDEEITPKKL
jgi:hypothetical protein